MRTEKIFEVCQRRVIDFVRSAGYLQAKFDEPKNEVTEHGLVVNDTARFEVIDKDRDIDFTTDEEEGFLDIVIKVDRINDP